MQNYAYHTQAYHYLQFPHPAYLYAPLEEDLRSNRKLAELPPCTPVQATPFTEPSNLDHPSSPSPRPLRSRHVSFKEPVRSEIPGVCQSTSSAQGSWSWTEERFTAYPQGGDEDSDKRLGPTKQINQADFKGDRLPSISVQEPESGWRTLQETEVEDVECEEGYSIIHLLVRVPQNPVSPIHSSPFSSQSSPSASSSPPLSSIPDGECTGTPCTDHCASMRSPTRDKFTMDDALDSLVRFWDFVSPAFDARPGGGLDVDIGEHPAIRLWMERYRPVILRYFEANESSMSDSVAFLHRVVGQPGHSRPSLSFGGLVMMIKCLIDILDIDITDPKLPLFP